MNSQLHQLCFLVTLPNSAVNSQLHNENFIAVLAIPQYIATTIWERAVTLLQQESNFAVAPVNNGKAWLVTRSDSANTSKPCFVQNYKGHSECESDCIYYQTSKVRAHIVVVAIRNGDLDRFIAFHKKLEHQVNTTKLAQSGLPMSSVGKNGYKTPKPSNWDQATEVQPNQESVSATMVVTNLSSVALHNKQLEDDTTGPILEARGANC